MVTFSRGDRVIFSSRAIPGNEKAVMRVINGLVSQGVEVITDRTHLVHVSGHPRRAELEEMISWVRPQILIPVHGEPLHMAEHADLARRAGVGKVADLPQRRPGEARARRPGDRRRGAGRPPLQGRLAPGRCRRARTVPDRRRLGFAGIVSVALALTERGELVGDPEIELTGIPEKDADGNLIAELALEAVLDAIDSMPRARRRDPDAVAEAARRAVRAAVGAAWNKKPMCHVHVLTV